MRKPRIRLPGQSWTIKEKIDWLVAVLTDHRLSYATRVIGATMALYFHNTQSGALHPSREQVGEKTGAERQKVRLATQALRKFGFLNYEDSSGGCNRRNTYQLLKQSAKVEQLTGTKNTQLTGGENTPQRVGKTPTQGVGKTPTQLPLESTSCEEERESSPLPCNSKASASLEKREEASREEPVVIPFDPMTTARPEKPFVVTEEEKARRLKVAAELKRTLRGVSAR